MGNGDFENLLKKPWKHTEIIHKDLERTIINNEEILPKSQKYKDWVKLLHAIWNLKADISYVQGMNHIAASLLEVFSPEEAFLVFKCLIGDYKLHKMYTGKFLPLVHSKT